MLHTCTTHEKWWIVLSQLARWYYVGAQRCKVVSCCVGLVWFRRSISGVTTHCLIRSNEEE
jgi:hypothetical protein